MGKDTVGRCFLKEFLKDRKVDAEDVTFCEAERVSQGEWRLSHHAPGLENTLILLSGAVHGNHDQLSISEFSCGHYKSETILSAPQDCY